MKSVWGWSVLLLCTSGCTVVTAPIALLSLPVEYAYKGLKGGVELLLPSDDSEEELKKEK